MSKAMPSSLALQDLKAVLMKKEMGTEDWELGKSSLCKELLAGETRGQGDKVRQRSW
jgi:hypothetical protein